MKRSTLFFCLLAGAAGSLLRTALPDAGPAPAPAAPAKAKDPPLKASKIKFEIQNFNYYDLTKETCPEKVINKAVKKVVYQVAKKERIAEEAEEEIVKEEKVEEETFKSDIEDFHGDSDEMISPIGNQNAPKPPWMGKKQTPKAPAPKSNEAPVADSKGPIQEVHALSESIGDSIRRGFGIFTGQDPEKPPWMKTKQDASFVQMNECSRRKHPEFTKSTECTTIGNVLRDVIISTVKSVMKCLYEETVIDLKAGAAPSSASMQPPSPAGAASFLTKGAGAVEGLAAPSPGPAPQMHPVVPELKMFVTFTPGRKIGKGVSTMVEITFIDTPTNGVKDMETINPFLVWCASHGVFVDELGNALYRVTNLRPRIHKMMMEKDMIEQWDIGICKKHLTSVVNTFTRHYTRRQVPMALYNECTNFMTRMSFSHDYVLDRIDTKRCRKATRKFAQHWNYGKNAEEADFEEMCQQSCEAKYGKAAPMCNVHAGDELHGKPHL